MSWFTPSPFTQFNPLAEAKDDITVYFESLGYEVILDFNTRKGERWYEILDDRGMFCQIDMGVELRHLVTDLTYWATSDDIKGISDGPDFKISNKVGCPRFKLLCERVAKKGLV